VDVDRDAVEGGRGAARAGAAAEADSVALGGAADVAAEDAGDVGPGGGREGQSRDQDEQYCELADQICSHFPGALLGLTELHFLPQATTSLIAPQPGIGHAGCRQLEPADDLLRRLLGDVRVQGLVSRVHETRPGLLASVQRRDAAFSSERWQGSRAPPG